MAFAVLSSSASAESPPSLFWQRCEKGEGAGQCFVPRGIASDPVTGNVYVADQVNARIVELTVWGEFVKAWGWGVRNGAAELQTCTTATTCRQGIEGDGEGQLDNPQGLALDSDGNLFVVDLKNNRVQKFDPGAGDGDAAFLLMFGGSVNKTKVEAAGPVTQRNLCPIDPGDVCQTGSEGTSAGEFSDWGFSSYIAAGPGGNSIYVGDSDRIQVFDLGGNFTGSIPVPGEDIFSLAVDESGNSFVSLGSGELFPQNPVKEDVLKLDPSGSVLCTATVESPRALAVDGSGNLYVAEGGEYLKSEGGVIVFPPVTVRKFSSACVEDPEFAFKPGIGSGTDTSPAMSTGLAVSEACEIPGRNLYLSKTTGDSYWVRAYGPHPPIDTCGPPPSVPPTISSQSSSEVGSTTATIEASINPHFWPDTTYYVEYGTGSCRAGECTQLALFPGQDLNSGDDAPASTGPVELSGLEPGMTYNFRFVAESSGGGPVYGIDPDGAGPKEASEIEGLEGAFSTYPSTLLPQYLGCSNDEFREGLSARLPHCRAYEMVSPVDKQGSDIFSLRSSTSDYAALDQSSAQGDSMTYSAYRAFADPDSAPYASQYLARRSQTGWSSEALSPFQEGLSFQEYLDTNYKAFNEDLCSGWILQPNEPLLAPEAIEGYANLYRRSNCGASSDSYEAISRIIPTATDGSGEAPIPTLEFTPSIQGMSADGSHTVFRAAGRLTGGAVQCSGTCPRRVFDFHEGVTKPVCVFPNNAQTTLSCTVGSVYRVEWDQRKSSVYGGVSDDGSRIFWTSQVLSSDAAGELYVRINGTETRRLSAQDAYFWGASIDGARALFNIPYVPTAGPTGDLFEYEVDAKKRVPVAEEVTGVLGFSKDMTKVYFTSKEVLSAAPNGHGDTAEAGKQNLYLHVAGVTQPEYIATLAANDVESALSAVHRSPYERTSRVTPDGMHALFTSAGALTGAENRDLESGAADTEVFLFDASSSDLRCVSCNPSGARPEGRQVIVNDTPTGVWQAGSIPGWTNQFHPSRVISQDGSRVYFNSTQRLLPLDTNQSRDVYEWDEANSADECEDLGAQLYLEKEGGCLSLISSGSEGGDSEIVDADTDGRNVFIRSSTSFVSQDPGQIDLYDLREGGGFPTPAGPDVCRTEVCQPSVPAPSSPPPGSTIPREGNVKPKPRRCPKGKHKVRKKGGGSRCVKNKQKHHRGVR